MKARILFVAIMCLCTTVDGYGRTITVDANGSGDYTTIQAAIDDANNADIVQVRPGTYQETINFLGKNITVTSLDPEDPCVVAATVIDANGLGSVVTFDHSETNQAVLTGFTITGGTGIFVFEAGGIEVYWGGGICCDNSSPTIVRNVIVGNNGPVEMDGNTPVVVSFGGGIVSMAGEPTITQNIIKDNSAYLGAAVAVISGDAKIVSNLIYENSAWFGGGAALIFGGQLLANTIVENSGQLGGGVCLLSDTVIGTGLVSGNIICDSTEGGGLYADSNGLDAVWYNNLHNNTPADYVETPNLTGIGGNISIDPCFVAPGYWDANGTPEEPNDDFWVDGDYHLKSQGWRWDSVRRRWDYDEVTSRCIDAGNPGSPLGDEPLSVPDDPNNIWGQNLRIDMGAFGGTAEASMPPYDWAILGDLTNDGLVNLKDYAFQAADWLNSADQQPGDLNRDSLIDISDFALLVEDWLGQTTWHE